jgi:hypothetical protein
LKFQPPYKQHRGFWQIHKYQHFNLLIGFITRGIELGQKNKIWTRSGHLSSMRQTSPSMLCNPLCS